MKIIKNNTGSPLFISDCGVTVDASIPLVIPVGNYPLWAVSNDCVIHIANGNITINDGSQDLSVSQGVALIQSNFKATDFVDSLKNSGRLKVDVNFSGDQLIKVSSDDQTSGYLGSKVIGTSGKIELSVSNDGGDEDLQINIGSDVFDKQEDTSADITNTPSGNISSTNVQAAINELDAEKQAISEKGQANGYASLDSNGKVPAGQLPSYVDDVLEYANLSAFPVTGETGKIYVALNNNKTYRWSGSVYVEISPSEVNSVFGRTGIVTAQTGDYTASQITNVPSGGVSSTNAQAAINELDTEKADKTTVVSAGSGLSGGGDLSANRTISMPNVGTPGTYGSSSQIPQVTTDSQGRVSGVSQVTVDKLYDHWHGTTQYNASQLRKYTNILNTDGNGRVTINLTQNGNVGGTALFSSILSVQATGDSSSNSDPLQAPNFFIESVTATQVIIRAVRGVSQGILLGGTVNTMQYVGSGIPAYIEITGVKS